MWFVCPFQLTSIKRPLRPKPRKVPDLWPPTGLHSPALSAAGKTVKLCCPAGLSALELLRRPFPVSPPLAQPPTTFSFQEDFLLRRWSNRLGILEWKRRKGASSLLGRGPRSPTYVSCSSATPRLHWCKFGLL